MRKRLGEALRNARANDDSRKRTMDAALSWSYGLLDPEQRELFASLAVFRSSFTVEDVERVCKHVSQPVSTLFELLDASLVSAVHAKDEMRYRLLETTRAFALEKLSGALACLSKAHAEHFACKADTLQQITDKCFSEVLEPTLHSMPDYLAALDYACERGWAKLGLRFLEGLHRFGMRNYFNEDLYARTVPLLECSQADTAAHARISRLAGMLAEACGRYGEAVVRFKIAVSYYRKAGDEARLCDALSGLAIMAFHQGQYAQCEERLLEIRERTERLGDAPLLFKTLGRLGALYLSQGEFHKSLPLLERAATGLLELGELRQGGTALKNLAIAAHYSGRHEDAVKWANLALDNVQVSGEIPMRAMTLCMRGCAHRELGEMPAALDSLLAGSAFFSVLGRSSDLAECLEDVASTLAVCGRYEIAARLTGYCEGLRREIGSPVNPGLRTFYDRTLALLAHALGPACESYRALGLQESLESASRLAAETLAEARACQAEAAAP
jgi:non-specific serine/threonine protein kinase